VPAEVRAQPATIVEIRAETDGKIVKWVTLTPGLSVRSIDGGKTLLVSGPSGRYELLAYTALGDVPSDPARVVVVIDGAAPPDPKAPDELKEKVRAALDRDKPKKADALQLAAIYREAAKLLADPEAITSAELLRRLRAVSADLVGPDVLPAVRAAVAEQLLAVLGMTSDEPITDARRKRAAELFLRLAVLIEELLK
jgi:hypothetical protein